MRFCHFSTTTRSGLAMNTDEYVPMKIPIQRMREKSFVDAGPKKKRVARTSITVREVLMERVNVCWSDLPTVVAKSFEILCFRFSRIRSKTTIVSCTDTPIIERRATTNNVSTSLPIQTNTPAGTMMSWRSVTVVIAPYFHEEIGSDTLRNA